MLRIKMEWVEIFSIYLYLITRAVPSLFTHLPGSWFRRSAYTPRMGLLSNSDFKLRYKFLTGLKVVCT